MRPDLLNVVAVYSNPRQYDSRIRLAKDFIPRMLDAGVSLTFVEHAFGDRPFEFDHIGPHVNLVQVPELASTPFLSFLPEHLFYSLLA